MPNSLTASMKRLAMARARKRRQALGPPLQMSDADLDILVNVGPTDQAEAARGWVPVGSLVPVGQRTCRSQCRCSIRYRREPAEMAA